MAHSLIFGMSETEEGQTSDEDDECIENDSSCNGLTNRLSYTTYPWLLRNIKAIDEHTSEWNDENNTSTNKSPSVMFLLTARTVTNFPKDNGHHTFVELSGVHYAGSETTSTHEPMRWLVSGYNPSFKLIIVPLTNGLSSESIDLGSLVSKINHVIMQSEELQMFYKSRSLPVPDNFVINLKLHANETIKNIWRITNTLADKFLRLGGFLVEVIAINTRVGKWLNTILESQPNQAEWKNFTLHVFEQNISHCRKFLASLNIKPSTFIQHVPELHNDSKNTGDFVIPFKDIAPFATDNINTMPIVIRTLSLDLECLVSSTQNDDENPAITSRRMDFKNLANIVQISLEVIEIAIKPLALLPPASQVLRRKKFLLMIGKCSGCIPDTTTFQIWDCNVIKRDTCETGTLLDAKEVMLLNLFEHLIHVLNPDIITGYNITQFDLPYIRFRMLLLSKKYGTSVVSMDYGRWSNCKVSIKELSSWRMPSPHLNLYNKIPGRVVLDMYVYWYVLLGNRKPGTLSLRKVAERNLPRMTQKLNPVFADVTTYMKEGINPCSLGKYCVRDAEISSALLHESHLKDFINLKNYKISPLCHILQESANKVQLLHHVGNKSLEFLNFCYVYFKHVRTTLTDHSIN